MIPRYNIKRIRNRLEGNTRWTDYIPPSFDTVFDLRSATNALIQKAYELGYDVRDIYPAIKEEDILIPLYPNAQTVYDIPSLIRQRDKNLFTSEVPTPILSTRFMGQRNFLTFYEGEWYLIDEQEVVDRAGQSTYAVRRFVSISKEDPILEGERELIRFMRFYMYVDVEPYLNDGYDLHVADKTIEFYKHVPEDGEPLLDDFDLSDGEVLDIYNQLKAEIDDDTSI